jgi:dihydrofolate synthase / folylpolyglutamate synthase
LRTHPGQWDFLGPRGTRAALAYPALRGARQVRNAAAALAALDALYPRIAISMQDVRRGLADAVVPGRFQVLPGRPQVILDVAHNPEAARALAEDLGAAGFAEETIGVFGMLRDKDIAAVARAVTPRITAWEVGSLGGTRGASAALVAQALAQAGITGPVRQHDSVATAFAAARSRARDNDKIVVFGSFLTVADVMQCLAAPAGTAAHG